jgi:superfamily II DNA or RNA helicase
MLNISKRNDCFLNIIGDQEDIQTVRECFTRFAPSYLWHPKYKSGQWDGRIRLFNSASNTLPYGLFSKLFDYLNENNIQYTVSESLQEDFDRDDFDEEIFQQVLDHFEATKKKDEIKEREYQIEGAKLALRLRRGQLHHATSSGKTFTLYLILSYLLRKNPNEQCAVVVPTIGLVNQFKTDYIDYGMDVDKMIGKYYGAEKDLDKPIVVGTWQSLQKAESFLKKITVCVSDENHQAKATNIKALLEKCTNASFRIGMSGSQHEDECDRMTVEGNFGPILSTVTARELMDKGYISNIDVFQLIFEYPDEIKRHLKAFKKVEGGKKAYDEEKDIVQNSTRRRSLVEKLVEKRGPKENILLIFDELEFGFGIYEYLKKAFPDRKCYYIAGEVKPEIREEIRVNANNEDGVLIIASLGTFSTGINLPKIHSIIALWIGKGLIKLQQSIGRGLRKHISKDKLRWFDIVDDLPYSKQHGMKRLQFYFREGFPVITHTIRSKS